MLFTKAMNKFLLYLENRNYAENTINDYRKRLRILKDWLEERYNPMIYIDDITFADLDDYLDWQQEKGNSGKTRNRDAYIISSFYKYLHKRDICDNVARKIEPVKTRKKERECLTREELNRILDAIEKPLIKIVTIFLYQTGCRINEVLSLKLADIDFDNNLLHIKQGKGNKNRNIALNSKLKSALKTYIKEDRPDVNTDYVFATKRTGSLSRSYYSRRLQKAVKKADVNKKISPHSIRHSTAVALIKKGVDLATIKDILGHENIQTTSVYVHSDMTRIRDALEAI